MGIRKCFRCGKELEFENYIKNSGPKTVEHFTKIWNSEYIELY
ncbi:hypothetical protein LCGC14_2967630, partial [marine sediment metagenome]